MASALDLSNIANSGKVPKPAGAAADTAKKKGEIGQQEFLQLLVNQLQHQDPLNPMENDQFAVQLAQFSSLEQLISIKNAVAGGGVGGSSSVGTMASFLGHEVALTDQTATVSGGRGPNLLVDVPEGAQTGRIDFIDASGQIAGTKALTELESGKQLLKLDGLSVPDGKYSVRMAVVNSAGKFADVQPKLTGTVEGFVLEPEAQLIVNGQNVGLDGVSEVYAGATK